MRGVGAPLGTPVGAPGGCGAAAGSGGEAACPSRLPAAVAYAHPNGPLKSSKQLISTTWIVFAANL